MKKCVSFLQLVSGCLFLVCLYYTSLSTLHPLVSAAKDDQYMDGAKVKFLIPWCEKKGDMLSTQWLNFINNHQILFLLSFSFFLLYFWASFHSWSISWFTRSLYASLRLALVRPVKCLCEALRKNNTRLLTNKYVLSNFVANNKHTHAYKSRKTRTLCEHAQSSKTVN